MNESGGELILIIEDDNTLASGLVYALEKEGYRTATAHTAAEARSFLGNQLPDLALLDIGLPDGNGFELCSMLHKDKDVPVIFLTALDDEVNVVMGLDMGGDDYITKPFRVKELCSRIKAVLRRTAAEPERGVLINGPYRLFRDEFRMTCGDTDLGLTRTEFRLAEMLVSNSGMILTRERLVASLWDDNEHYVDDNTLSVYIKRFRQKLGAGDCVETVRGIGYRWTME